MISLFKINDPYRLILVFLLLILLRLPYLITGPVTTIPQLEWMVLGEKMSSGSTLYVNVFHPTGPVSAGVYWIFNEIFGRSILSLHIAAMLLIFVQAAMLGILLINHRAFNQNTYIPSLIYVILVSFFPDSAILSPQLISITFLLMAFNLVFRHIASREKSDWVMLYAGIYFGLAALSFLPASLFVLSTLVTLAMFTSTSARRYFLLIYGFLIPGILVWLYYFWKNDTGMLFLNYFESFAYRSAWQPYNFLSLILMIGGPILFVLMALYRIVTHSNLTNIQLVFENFMFLTLVTGLITLSLDYYSSSFGLIILFLPAAYFIAQLLISIERNWLAEIFFLVFFVITLVNGYASGFGVVEISPRISARKIIPQADSLSAYVAGKKILSVGDHTGIYRYGKLATPYLSWAISKKYLENAGNPDVLIAITRQMLSDLPEVIIDDKGVMKHIFSLSPVLADKYRTTGTNGIYYLRNLKGNQN